MSVADTEDSWAVSTSREVFSGAVVGVRVDSLRDGPATFNREVITHPGAVAVVALDAEDRVLVVVQYRHPAQHRLVELPAGLLDVEGEPPMEAARRELSEEGKVESTRWSHLMSLRPSPGISTEVVHLYLAEDCRESAQPEGFEASHEEATMTRQWVPLPELVDAVLRGTVTNAITVAGSLAVWQLRHEKRRSELLLPT